MRGHAQQQAGARAAAAHHPVQPARLDPGVEPDVHVGPVLAGAQQADRAGVVVGPGVAHVQGAVQHRPVAGLLARLDHVQVQRVHPGVPDPVEQLVRAEEVAGVGVRCAQVRGVPHAQGGDGHLVARGLHGQHLVAEPALQEALPHQAGTADPVALHPCRVAGHPGLGHGQVAVRPQVAQGLAVAGAQHGLARPIAGGEGEPGVAAHLDAEVDHGPGRLVGGGAAQHQRTGSGDHVRAPAHLSGRHRDPPGPHVPVARGGNQGVPAVVPRADRQRVGGVLIPSRCAHRVLL